MASRLSSILLGALAAIPALTDAASVTIPRQEADSRPGFISFPIKRGERSSKTLTGRQAAASLNNEQDTSYTIELTFGSNAQPVKVAIDSGSDELFVDPNCQDRDFTNGQEQQCEQNGNYNPSTSTSAKATGQTSQIVYGSGAVDISYYLDSIGIPGASKNLSAVKFGKATSSQDLNEGILGLGFGEGVNLNYSNFVDALQQQGVTNTRAFSVALGTSDNSGGSIVFGGVDTKKFSGSLTTVPIETPTAGDIQRYAVGVDSIAYTTSSGTSTLANSALTGVVLDTGSSLCALPSAVVSAIANEVDATEDRQSQLYTLDCSRATSATKLEFAFTGGVTIAVPMSEFVLRSGNTCVLGVMALDQSSGITALLGDTFLRNAVVVFDQANMKIGLAQYSECGTNVQAIQAGATGASGFTGECQASSSASNSTSSGNSGKSAASGLREPPAVGAVVALVAGLAVLGGLF